MMNFCAIIKLIQSKLMKINIPYKMKIFGLYVIISIIYIIIGNLYFNYNQDQKIYIIDIAFCVVSIVMSIMICESYIQYDPKKPVQKQTVFFTFGLLIFITISYISMFYFIMTMTKYNILYVVTTILIRYIFFIICIMKENKINISSV
jgi:hypothetical protein